MSPRRAICANCSQPISFIPEEAEWIHENFSTRCAMEFYAIPGHEERS